MRISKPANFNTVEINLPGSKSESNRALIMQALCDEEISIHYLSNSDDTTIINRALSSKQSVVDCEQSGAALRFLCAYFSIKENNTVILTGSQRLKERPLKNLVDALKELGAHIEYLEKVGYAPIKITGKKLISNHPININANISSQFITALLLIAPKIKNGLQLHLENEVISAPYLKMTMQMMHQCKIHILENDKSIIIPEQEYQACELDIESDWSAASYWYGMVSLGLGEIKLQGLYKNSLQGDAAIAELMLDFGVETVFEDYGILIRKNRELNVKEEYDFSNTPDLAQSIIVLSAMHKKNIRVRGIDTLAIKETNRIEALKNELEKINVQFIQQDLSYQLICNEINLPESIEIKTYHDHRMAMSFAMLSMIIPFVYIDNKEVVNKSYPGFWVDLSKVGFRI